MIRFKVIKGSHLLLGAAIVLLALVVGVVILSAFMSGKPEGASTYANLVQKTKLEAETDSVFASSNASEAALHLDPYAGMGVRVEIISSETAIPDSDMPAVLIYHTHTHEAYEQVSGDHYVAIEAWRTMDQDYSVVRVGEELAKQLRALGFEVVHDITDHEQNELSTAYTRSLATLEAYDRSFDLYIDLHRDAYIEGAGALKTEFNGESLAQLMFLIGNGNGFEVKPFYEENLRFAQLLTQRINNLKPGLCKEVLIKDGRYNQNIGVFSILVEVGHNRNTLAEAISALPYLANGLHSLMIAEPDSELVQMKTVYDSSIR